MNWFYFIWNNWLIASFAATSLWAIVNLIDVYFVGRVFEDEFDSIVAVGLFQGFPLLYIFSLKFIVPDANIVCLAIIAGFLNIVAMFFYFKALFTTNDATIVALLWNINILLIPIIAFFVVGEKLTLIQYLGLLIAFLGATLISIEEKIKQRNLLKVAILMTWAIIFLSVSMTISDKIYRSVEFLDGFLFFSLGSLIGGVFFAIIRKLSFKKKSRISILKLNRSHFFGFIFAETLFLVGILFSQRAIDLSPAVSFISVVESSQTFFILIISAIIYLVLPLTSFDDKHTVKLIYKDQLIGYKMKIIASVVIAIGIYMLNIK